MSDVWPYEPISNARVEAYFEAAIQNPRSESTHSVNLGQVAANLGVEVDVHDLTAAVEHVNTQHNVQPPIRLLGKIASEEGKNEMYYTSANGIHARYVWSQLLTIALGKLRAKNSGNL